MIYINILTNEVLSQFNKKQKHRVTYPNKKINIF